MSWETRWREMVLAGGSVVVAACSGGQVVTGNVPVDGSGGSSSGSSGGSGGASSSGSTPNFCCNANGDPCCQYENCGGPLTTECSAELACKDAGTWSLSGYCVVTSDAGPSDAGPADAGPADVITDQSVEGGYPPFCCNANGDPCCQYRYCGGPLTAECISEEACQSEGGVYDPYTLYAPDGSIGSSPSCTLPSADGGGD
jgi:hypothetical protein